jgi:hypothetical protein
MGQLEKKEKEREGKREERGGKGKKKRKEKKKGIAHNSLLNFHCSRHLRNGFRKVTRNMLLSLLDSSMIHKKE